MSSKPLVFSAICLTALLTIGVWVDGIIGQEKSESNDFDFPTPQEIIDKYVQALGGYELLSSREVVHYVSSGYGSDGTTFTFEAFLAEGKYKSQYVMENGRVTDRGIQSEGKFAADGSRIGYAWEITNGVFRELVDGEKQDYLRRSSAISSVTRMFTNYKSITFDGSESIDGRECYKLIVTDHDGKAVENYYDAKTGLLRRQIGKEFRSNRQMRVVRDFLNFEPVGEFTVWKKLVYSQEDGQQWTYEVEEYEVDARVPRGTFDVPPAMKTLIAQAEAPKKAEPAEAKVAEAEKSKK